MINATGARAAASPAKAAGVAPDATILSGRRLQPGTIRSELSVFADDVWDLNPAVFRRNGERVRLDFSRFGPAFRSTAKEAIYARLNVRCGPYRPANPHTAAALFCALGHVQAVLADVGVERLDELCADDLTDWLPGALATQPRSRTQLVVTAFRFLALAEAHLTSDRLRFVPWGGRSWHRIAALPGKGENETARLPEAVFVPLMRHALLYIRHFASDIIAASDEHAAPPAPRSGPAEERLRDFVARRRAAGFGIPGNRHRGSPLRPAWRRIAAQAGVPYSTLADQPRLRAMVDASAEELGLDDGPTLLHRPGTHPDTGRPWRAAMTPQDLSDERRNLLAACYAVIAFLSGMRESEIHSLQRGCATKLGRRGEHEVWRLKGTAYKGHDAPGSEEQWIVLEPVVEAIGVLEQLTEGQHLFTKTSHNQGRESITGTNRLLRKFVVDLNAHHDAGIPVHPITTRQFRRTTAWYIANRPFGVVAGMIQFKHVRTATFLGYAGTSPSGFTAEIDAEERTGRIADILERYEDWKLGAPATGPAAKKLAAEFDHIRSEAGDLPGQLVDRRRLERLLATTARTLHVGPLSDCLFDRSKARCLTAAGRPDAEHPVPNLCQPNECPNSRIDDHHLPGWQDQKQAAIVWLETRRLAGHQRASLERSRDDAAAIISSVEGVST